MKSVSRLFFHLLLLVLPITIFPNISFASKEDSSLVEYFRDRIKDYEKSGDYNFQHRKNLPINQVASAKERIWELWKKANTTFEQLPRVTTEAPREKYDYPIYSWKLMEEDPMPFYYFKKQEKPAGGYPLFLNTHGSGPKSSEFLATLKWSLVYQDGPSVYFIPQIPNEKRYRWWFKSKQYAWEKLFRLAMIDDTFNPNKLYVMGISEGGYGSQRLAAFYADYLAGAGPMAGGEPLENAPPLNFRHMAFSLETGEKDTGFGRNKLTLAAKNQFDSLSRVYPGDFIHKINLQEGKGHSIDYRVTTPWLVNYSRKPRPIDFEWILFPMDGRYRRSFYNVFVRKPLNISEEDEFDRASFKFRIDKKDNAIYLETKLQDKMSSKSKPVDSGEISIYLAEDMLDLSKKIKVYYQGKLVENKKLKLSEGNIIASCAIFADPERLFPARVDLKL